MPGGDSAIEIDRLSPQHIGRRVVVRHQVGLRDGRPLFADVLGDLLEWHADALVIRTDRGDTRVELSRIVLAKPVPPKATATPRQIAKLEAIAARGWLPADHATLGDWLLRAADGWTVRANSVLALGSPGRPLTEAIGEVRSWYAARGRPAWFNVPMVPANEPLSDLLKQGGWVPGSESLVQVAPVDGLIGGRLDDRVTLDASPASDFLTAIADWKTAAPPSAHALLMAGDTARFAIVKDPSGAVMAGGRGVLTDGWLGLSLIWVEPAARRQGLARAIVSGLAGWAAAGGALRSYLQVESTNAVAAALYAGMGFHEHHRYVSWTRAD